MKILSVLLICGSHFVSMAQQEIRLIVRGDDMGYSHSGNLALIRSYKEGIETSIEVIVPSPWFPEAVQMLKENPSVDVGVHIALTSEWDNIKWRPLTAAKTLRDSNGYFFPMVFPNKNYPGQSIAENNPSLHDIEMEMRAQIEMAMKHIPRISHISGHMGCTNLNEDVKALVARLTREYNLLNEMDLQEVVYISFGKPLNSPAEKINRFLELINTMQPGKTYLFVEHPGLDNEELRSIHHVGYENVAGDRQGVTDLFTSEKVKAAIRKKNIKLIGYRELKNN